MPRVFISHSHKDLDQDGQTWLERLRRHFAPDEFAGELQIWDDTKIAVGTPDWEREIEDAISSSSAAVLLVGPEFLASPFIMSKELPRILARHKDKALPLVTNTCRYLASPLRKIQAFNKGKPLDSIRHRREQEKVLVDFASEVANRIGTDPPPPPPDALRMLGIVGGSPRLDQSEFEPKACIKRCLESLSFLGISATKWLEDGMRFEQFLTRMDELRNKGTPPGKSDTYGLVRFLLLSPSSPFSTLSSTAKDPLVVEQLKELSRRHRSSFKVKYYEDIPCLRLTFIDEMTLGLAPYRMDLGNVSAPESGREAPHLTIQKLPDTPWSLYDPFRRHFEKLWRRSADAIGVRTKP